MKILKRFTLGKAFTHCYLIEHKNNIILIDAPPGIEKVALYLKANNLNIDKIYLTHAHYDHIVGLKYLIENNFIKSKNIYCPDDEIFALDDPSRNGNLSALAYSEEFVLGYPVTPISKLNDDDIELRFLKGHSLQSTVYIFNKEKSVFSGDVIFDEEMQSKYFVMIPFVTKGEFLEEIKNKILTLPDDYYLHAGHTKEVKVEERKKENRFK